MICIQEKSSFLYLTGDNNDLYTLSDALKFKHPNAWNIDLYRLWRNTDGKKGWDGMIKPLKIDRSGVGVILRGHKDDLLARMAKMKINLDRNSKLLDSPFKDMTTDDIDPRCIAGEFPLDQNQIQCILQWLRHGTGIGKIAVNGGKTAAFAGFAATLKQHMGDARFVYITDRERLQSQVGGEMPKFLPGWDITKFGGGDNDCEGKDLVVCTLAMLRKHKDDLQAMGWFNTFNAVMFDESHHAAADSSEDLVCRFGGAFFKVGASDTIKEEDPIAQMRVTGLLGPVRMQVDQLELIEAGRSAQPHIYIVDPPGWRGRHEATPYQPEIGSKAWALINGSPDLTPGIYKGPVMKLDDVTGEVVTKKTRVLEGTKFVSVTAPVTVPGLHTIEIGGVDYEVDSSYCLLDRSVDVSIVRFKERNELITEWSTFFAKQGKRTLVVATRLMHTLILETLICDAYNPDLVR